MSAVADDADWTTDASATGGTLSLADASGNVAGGVEVIRMETTGQASGDVAKFVYSNVSLSDGDKRVPFLGMNVKSVRLCGAKSSARIPCR